MMGEITGEGRDVRVDKNWREAGFSSFPQKVTLSQAIDFLRR